MRFSSQVLPIASLCAVALTAASTLVQAAPLPVITQNTPITLSIDTPLRSGQTAVGETVHYTVTQDVVGPNHVVLVAKGAPATGHVTLSTPKGSFGTHGRLVYTIDYVRGVSGVQVPLHLTVTADSDIGAAAEAAEETDALEYRPFQDLGFGPDGYVQSGDPGGYYFQQKGLEESEIYDPGRFFGGVDAVVKRGQKYTAKVEKNTPLDRAAY